jgi:hypothetical protein
MRRAERGQRHAARPPVEQPHAELALELSEVLGERRLADADGRRGCGQAAALGDREELLQQARGHAASYNWE